MKQNFFFSNFFANLFLRINSLLFFCFFLFSLLISTSAKSNESDNLLTEQNISSDSESEVDDLIIEDQEFSDFLSESMRPVYIRIGCWPKYTMFTILCDIPPNTWQQCAARACGVRTERRADGKPNYVYYGTR